MKVYLAGPMSGIKSFNIPAFDRMATRLRGLGHEVISPAELDGPEVRQVLLRSPDGGHDDLPIGETWGFYLSRDIAMLADDGIEAVVVLSGWETSKGARLETFMVRAILNLPVCHLVGGSLMIYSDAGLLEAWMPGLRQNLVHPLRTVEL